MSVALVAAATYGALFVAELGLWWKNRPTGPLAEQQRGLYLPDPVTGGVLKPGYDRDFDDGYASGHIRINSLGDRDDEPRPDATNRILLIGDSFAFGLLLDQSATIDKWIERDRPGTDAYNLGVSGYDLPNQLDALRRTHVRGREVVYLFYGNDLRPPREETVIDGYRVTRLYGRGDIRLTDAQMAAKVRAYAKPVPPRRLPPLRSLLLPEIRNLARRAIGAVESRGTAVDYNFPAAQRGAFIARGVRYTLDMQALAKARGMGFHLVIIPSVVEVRAGRHATAVAGYMARMRAVGITPIDLMPKLSTDNYWSHDLHFRESGAKIAARTIVAALPAAPGGR